MGHQYQVCPAIWVCFLEKEETIQERPYFDFLLSKQIRETSSGYSTHHWLHAVTTLAPNYGSVGRTSDLASCSSFSIRYTAGYTPTGSQWWSSWIFQFSTTRPTPWCSQFSDFGMETSSPRHCPFCWHVPKGQPTTTLLCWKDSQSPKEDQGDFSGWYFHDCTGIAVLPYFPSRQCHLATDPRGRYRFPDQPLTVQSCGHYCGTLLDASFQRSDWSTLFPVFGHQICRQPVHFVSGRQETWTCHSSSFTGWLLSTSRRIGGSHHQWTVGFCCWFQPSNGDIQTPRTMANSRFCICREYWSSTLWFTVTMPPYFPLFLSKFGKSKSNSLIDSTLRSQRLLNPRLLQSHSENPKRTSSTGHCAVVRESNSVPKRSKLLSWEFSWCSCRGTQEAHRAVSNEALYGVFRISGPITLTYLHLWNCWQAVLIPCFPALGPRTLSPHTIIIAFNQFLSRSFLFLF